MSDRLISADKLYMYFLDKVFTKKSWTYYEIEEAINSMPSVDAVPVVRCKDCVHNHSGEYCENDTYVKPDGYCHWGERRENAEID